MQLLEGKRAGLKIALLCGTVLAAGVGIGLLMGRGHRAATTMSTASPALPHAAEHAAPPVSATHTSPQPDPQPTETGRETVTDEEPAVIPPAPPPPVTSVVPETTLPVKPAEPSVAVPVPIPAAPKGTPTWKRYALAAPEAAGRPIIAVIIDDMGVDKKRSEKILQLPGPLTVSLMSYADDLPRLSEEARRQGDEIMMHLPMEPMGEGIDPGPGALLTALSVEENRKRLTDDLDRFNGYVGINNHMGSKYTANTPGMTMVMEELRRRGMLFIDSVTTDHSVGLDLARRYGVPTAGRNVFLDNGSDLASVERQLLQTEMVARKKGTAIAIGHPRDATIQALSAWLPTLEKKGFVLVPVTAVVRARMSTDSAVPPSLSSSSSTARSGE